MEKRRQSPISVALRFLQTQLRWTSGYLFLEKCLGNSNCSEKATEGRTTTKKLSCFREFVIKTEEYEWFSPSLFVDRPPENICSSLSFEILWNVCVQFVLLDGK